MREEPILDIPDHIKALPEPEQGPALVEAIHRRKRWDQRLTDALRVTAKQEGADKVEYTQRLNGPSSLRVWIDEAQQWRDAYAPSEWDEVFDQSGRLSSVSVEFQCVDVSNEFMALMLGYSSVEEMLKEQAARRHLEGQVDYMLRKPVDAPPVDVDNVRWPSDNRKLYARRDGKTSEIYRMLGIKES